MDRVFVDMKGVIAAWQDSPPAAGVGVHSASQGQVDFEQTPLPGAISALKRVRDMGFDVFLVADPSTTGSAYVDKMELVRWHLPELKDKLVLTNDKSVLGDPGDILLSASSDTAGFKGLVLEFTADLNWPSLLEQLDRRSPTRLGGVDLLIGVGDHQQALRNLQALTTKIVSLKAMISQPAFGVARRGARAWSGVEVEIPTKGLVTILDKATCEEGIILDREGAITQELQDQLRAIEHANDIAGGNDRGDAQLLSEIFDVQIDRVLDVVTAIWHAVHTKEGDPSLEAWSVAPQAE